MTPFVTAPPPNPERLLPRPRQVISCRAILESLLPAAVARWAQRKRKYTANMVRAIPSPMPFQSPRKFCVPEKFYVARILAHRLTDPVDANFQGGQE